VLENSYPDAITWARYYRGAPLYPFGHGLSWAATSSNSTPTSGTRAAGEQLRAFQRRSTEDNEARILF
jgi:hypothetical protein